jgi:hypothetical protein
MYPRLPFTLSRFVSMAVMGSSFPRKIAVKLSYPERKMNFASSCAWDGAYSTARHVPCQRSKYISTGDVRLPAGRMSNTRSPSQCFATSLYRPSLLSLIRRASSHCADGNCAVNGDPIRRRASRHAAIRSDADRRGFEWRLYHSEARRRAPRNLRCRPLARFVKLVYPCPNAKFCTRGREEVKASKRKNWHATKTDNRREIPEEN